MRLHSICIKGEATASKTAAFLVKKSQWFVFDPLPDGHYDFRVKSEYAPHLLKYLNEAKAKIAWISDITGMEQAFS